MNIRFTLFLIAFLSLSACIKASEKDELQRIRENYIRSLVTFNEEPADLIAILAAIPPETEISDQVVAELHQRYPFNVEKITSYIHALQPDGSWKDINYEDKMRSGWEPKLHAERILEMTKLYCSKQTTYYQSAWIEEAIHKALNFWFTTKPVCLNWWQNQIGVPKTLGGAFILFEDKLSAKEKEGAIEVMENAKFGMTGQNKVWLAGNVMIRGLLQNDYPLVKEARDIIASEIVTGQVEGIKEDWSFHQHGPQQQFGNYGLAFISGMSFFSGIFSGTSLCFNEEQSNILHSLIEEGYRWIIWNGYMDISALDRQLYHNAQIHKALALEFSSAPAPRRPHGTLAPAPRRYKHFDQSDYTIYRSSQWMASVKMASNRVIGTELVNEDNLKGYYMADGATYFYIRGDEYLNDFPFWDWRKVPGITAYEDTAPLPRAKKNKNRNETDFVGGVTNGRLGLTTMELNRDGLHARKSWIFTDDYVLCLGSRIQSDSTLAVTTSIDQRGKRSELYYLNGKQWESIENEKLFNAGNLRFFHDNTGYILLDKTPCTAQSEKRSGQWHDFMGMYRPKMEEKEMISLHLNHGTKPTRASYRYIVLPAASREETATFNTSFIQIIKDDQTAQAVYLPKENTLFIVAYAPTTLKLKSGFRFEAKERGLYLIDTSGNSSEIYFKKID